MNFPETQPEQYLNRNVTPSKEIMPIFDRHHSGASAKHQQTNAGLISFRFYANDLVLGNISAKATKDVLQRRCEKQSSKRPFCEEFTRNKSASELSTSLFALLSFSPQLFARSQNSTVSGFFYSFWRSE